MKKTILLFLLALLCLYRSYGQRADSTIYLAIRDTTALLRIDKTSSGLMPIFNDQGVNDIVRRYSYKTFQVAFPSSRFPDMHRIYKVVASSGAVAGELTTHFPTLFPESHIVGPAIPIAYYPNDYSSPLHPCPSCDWNVYTWYLDYIHAPQAWDSTLGGSWGDSSIVIGVTDTWIDETNPDFAYKLARVGPNDSTGVAELNHGTQVAGLIAGGTDNGWGYPAIGFNCRVDFSNAMGDEGMLELSGMYHRRILNASWMNASSENAYVPSLLTIRDIYDEIYENGTIAVVSAGNGYCTGGCDPAAGVYNGIAPWLYCFPASYDHNISVTQIMGENCASAGGSGPCCDCHTYMTDTLHRSHQHNDKVDICAPGWRTGGLDYNPYYPTSDSRHYMSHDADGGGGTSYSAPLVAGTLGLMLSSNPCLSPYQLEYALKKNADTSIYSVPENANYTANHRIGVGKLNAASAVQYANPNSLIHMNCNDVATQTFFIKGIELNSICAPGFSSNGIKPVLRPILVNGTPPYTYRWEAEYDNEVLLDNYAIANPTIIMSSGTRVAYLKLTVYDASFVQKVASRKFRIQLDTLPVYDLAMRDSYLDMLDEPNAQTSFDPRERDVWESPDIWNRHTDDGIKTTQNIEYFSAGTPNYMYMRVRNVGCASYDAANAATLHAYWTLSSTGENWPYDWTVTQVDGASGIPVDAGKEVTTSPVAIPDMQPGDTFVAAVAWHPANPSAYEGTPSSVDMCMLARIVEPLHVHMPGGVSDNGITFLEGHYTMDNVRKNNNIVTRNTVDVNLGHKGDPQIHRVYVSDAGLSADIFSLHLETDKDIFKHFAGNLSEYMYVSLHLNDNLYKAWAAGGFHGSYATFDQGTQTVTYDPSVPLSLENITLKSSTTYYADMTFALRDSVDIEDSVADRRIYFRQYDAKGNLYGSVSYAVTIHPDDVQRQIGAARHTIAAVQDTKQSYSVYPNPMKDVIHILYKGRETTVANVTILDVTGRQVMQRTELALENGLSVKLELKGIAAGTYLILIQDKDGFRKTFKAVKL